MKALVLNCTLKPSPQPSNTEALAEVVIGQLRAQDIAVETIRVVDHHIAPGGDTDMGDGDQWPALHDKLLAAQILLIASPIWLGRPSSVAQRVLERMSAMCDEVDPDGRPVAYNRVAGVVVTGNCDGAHHVITEISGALLDIGYTIPGRAWTYWHLGPDAGPDYLEDLRGHDWSARTGRTAARNLIATARALAENPLPAPVRLASPAQASHWS